MEKRPGRGQFRDGIVQQRHRGWESGGLSDPLPLIWSLPMGSCCKHLTLTPQVSFSLSQEQATGVNTPGTALSQVSGRWEVNTSASFTYQVGQLEVVLSPIS